MAKKAESSRPESHDKPRRYLYRFMADFGRECYKTWRQELLASVIGAIAVYVIGRAHDTLAWSNLRTALWASALTLAAFACWHLLLTGYRLTKPGRTPPAILPAIFGSLIVLSMCCGCAYIGVFLSTQFNASPPDHGADSGSAKPLLQPSQPSTAAQPQPALASPAPSAPQPLPTQHPYTIAEINKIVHRIGDPYSIQHPNAGPEELRSVINKELERERIGFRVKTIPPFAHGAGGIHLEFNGVTIVDTSPDNQATAISTGDRSPVTMNGGGIVGFANGIKTGSDSPVDVKDAEVSGVTQPNVVHCENNSGNCAGANDGTQVTNNFAPQPRTLTSDQIAKLASAASGMPSEISVKIGAADSGEAHGYADQIRKALGINRDVGIFISGHFKGISVTVTSLSDAAMVPAQRLLDDMQKAGIPVANDVVADPVHNHPGEIGVVIGEQ